ncbi:MAG: peptide ABC transporter substrate-binding protein, partial [Pseudomonadota bacterium]
AAEAIMAMLQDVGFNVRLEMNEVGTWVDIFTKPFAEDRPPSLHEAQHDNNNGDAVFTVFFKYHCDGAQSTSCDPEVDRLIEAATVAIGEERRSLWQQAFRRINEEIIADVMMFHMVGYTRVGPRITFTPSISTNSELQLGQITFN